MYEGMLSLMQMAKTSAPRAACLRRLPYISVLTIPPQPVMASFASLGAVIMAEPKSMIGFAGPRVIRNHPRICRAIPNRGIPEEHGLIDLIVHRKKMRRRSPSFLITLPIAP